MGKDKKPSAASRTVDMFAAPAPIDDRQVEVLEAEEKEDRVTLEEDADRMRAQAFTVQDWTTKHFASPEATGNEYRISLRGGMYYVETLRKGPDGREAYGYVGLMVPERDLYALATCLVQAVRAKQAKEQKPSAAQ